jgi:FkbM family methyltransferase
MITIEKYNQTFRFNEDDISMFNEIFGDNYKVIEKGVIFEPNDIVIDIGANIGMFSILFAKLHPYITIYAIEPVAETYIKLYQNIKLNNLTNIIPINTAISGGEKIKRIIYQSDGLGGASSYVKDMHDLSKKTTIYTGCITLDELIVELNIKSCKMLKIDCEGAEYDILYNSKLLERINYLVGEFHENTVLRQAGHSWNSLAHYCSTHVKNMLYFEWCEMHE